MRRTPLGYSIGNGKNFPAHPYLACQFLQYHVPSNPHNRILAKSSLSRTVWIKFELFFYTANSRHGGAAVARERRSQILNMRRNLAVSRFSSSKTQILLEAGTNELEVLVFSVNGLRCGVNVAKIREVLEITDVTPTPGNHDGQLQGVVRVRDQVVPLAHLSRCLFPNEQHEDSPEDQMLLLEFNQDVIGFRVENVERIFRMSWQDVQPVPETLGLSAPVTGIVLLDDAMIPMLDFESLGARLGMPSLNRDPAESQAKTTDKSELPIVYADDSPLLRAMVHDRLSEAGYTNLHGFRDGREAWDFLNQQFAESSDGSQKVAAVVSDIEMPRMDGLTLTRQIRATPNLAHLPVILFSSIASDANENKAQQVGADAQISKGQGDELVPRLQKLLSEGRVTQTA